jgi:hypothetical protein
MNHTRALWATVLAAASILSPPHLSAQPTRLVEVGTSDLEVGEAGIAWYTTWETAKAEGLRSGRPIMFVAAATQCSGVSGVF